MGEESEAKMKVGHLKKTNELTACNRDTASLPCSVLHRRFIESVDCKVCKSTVFYTEELKRFNKEPK